MTYEEICDALGWDYTQADSSGKGLFSRIRNVIEQLEQERDQLAAQNEAMREAIELYFNQYPHMMKGYILDAINSPNLAAEVLKRRDAETLRRAADRFDSAIYGGDIGLLLRLWASEIEKETT